MRSLKHLFVGVAFLLVSGCGGQEEQVLNVFFTAIQGGDDNVIQSVSARKVSGRRRVLGARRDRSGIAGAVHSTGASRKAREEAERAPYRDREELELRG